MNANATRTSLLDDEQSFIALANEALDTGDLRSARSIAAQYRSSHGSERRLHRLARRFHLAA
jgi:hypothetical protein